MEPAPRYIVRNGKKGGYVVAVAPPHWPHRDVPGFANEADARAWIASRSPKPWLAVAAAIDFVRE